MVQGIIWTLVPPFFKFYKFKINLKIYVGTIKYLVQVRIYIFGKNCKNVKTTTIHYIIDNSLHKNIILDIKI